MANAVSTESVARRGFGNAWFLLLALVVVGLDQGSKFLIRNGLAEGERWPDEGPFRLVHFTNSGAAFGILQGEIVLLVITSVVGAAAILVYLFNPGFAHPLHRFGLALMLGGAIGNLIDRVRVGEVVDFLKLPRWPAFNVADSSITVGVMVLLWVVLREKEKPSPDS